MNDEELKRWVSQYNPNALVADGLGEAAIGIAERCGKDALVVYDVEKCIEILMRDSEMTEEEAYEYFHFNTLGAWAGEGTPLFLWRPSNDEDDLMFTDTDK